MRAHLYGYGALAPAGAGEFSGSPHDDADYLNASPLARFIARLLMRFS